MPENQLNNNNQLKLTAMKKIINEYDQQALDFLKETKTEFKAEFLKFGKHFDDDKEIRDIYKITLTRGSRKFSFDFGQSVYCSMQYIPKSIYAKNIWNKANCPRLMGENKNGALKKANIYSYSLNENDFVKNENFEEPTAYSVLACLTKYDPGTLEDFCSEFGYDEDSKKIEKIYKAVVDEYKNIAMLFTDEEIEQLAEIQ